jgi:hypothetical protein
MAGDSLDELIIKLFFALAFVCVLSGTLLCLLNFGANTTVKIFGIEWSTTSVGIAFVAIGVFTPYLAVRIVLKNRREIERNKRIRRTALRVARSKPRKSAAGSRGTHRRRTLPKVVDSSSPSRDAAASGPASDSLLGASEVT